MSADHFIVSIVKSFGLHIFVGVGLLASVSLSDQEPPKPKVIQVQPIAAVSVDKTKLAAQISKIKAVKANKKRAEEKRVADLEKRANKAQNKRQKEETKIKDLTKKTRQSQADKRRADAAAKKAKKKQRIETEKANRAASDAKKKLNEKIKADKAAADAKARKRKAELDEKKADEARKAKIAKDKAEKRRKAKEARERKEQEMAMQEQMAQEQMAREQAHNTKVLSEIEKFRALIIQRISQNIIRDETMKGKSCRLHIKLAFNGLVTSVKVLDGDTQVCQAAESGLYKSGKLPVSDDPAVFKELKNIIINYIPEIN